MRLGSTPAIATVAVSDLGRAAVFYGGKLELQEHSREGEEVISYRTGGTVLNVYRSQYAGTNEATAVAWDVGTEIEPIVAALVAKGVAFEHYDDMPGLVRQGDIHAGGGMKVAWFKDPDGNILNLIGR